MYSGHKKSHMMKSQSIVTPSSLVATFTWGSRGQKTGCNNVCKITIVDMIKSPNQELQMAHFYVFMVILRTLFEHS